MILQALAWATAALFVAFETTAVYEYLKLLPFLEKITKIKEYEQEKTKDFTISYIQHMDIFNNSFFYKMASCPYCIGFWISLGFSVLFSCFLWFPVVFLGSVTGHICLKTAIAWMEKLHESD